MSPCLKWGVICIYINIICADMNCICHWIYKTVLNGTRTEIQFIA